MKSLEHLIRDIREGKAEKGNKDSLAHAIRKVHEGKRDDIDASAGKYGGFDKMNTESDLNYMGSGTGGEPKMHAEDGKKKKTDEAVSSIGTDDYQGNQFKSVRTQTPHIKPPAGSGSHSQAPENVSRQRTLAKEKGSMTMHGKVNEEDLQELRGLSDTDIEKIVLGKKVDKEVFLPGPELPDIISSKAQPKPTPKGPIVTKPTPAQIPTYKPPQISPGRGPKPDIGKPETPTPAPAPKTPAAPKPAAPETPTPAPAPRELPKIIPGVVPGGLPLPVPFVKPEEKTKEAPATKVEPRVIALPTIDISARTKTAADTKVAPASAPVPVPASSTPKTDATSTTPKLPPIKMGMPVIGQIPGDERGTRWTTHSVKHSARKHRSFSEQTERKEIENVPRKGDRKSIAYVGRSEDDPKTTKEKTSRQAAYKINVIDEGKKLAGIVLSTVKDKKQQMKSKTEDGIGQTSKDIQYPNGTVVRINPEISRTTMDIDGKLPNDYK
jgi:hypothetical protein